MNIVSYSVDSGGLSSLVPLIADPNDDDYQVLSDTGQLIFSGALAECDRFMLSHGLRPHCNCELIAPAHDAVGWEAF